MVHLAKDRYRHASVEQRPLLNLKKSQIEIEKISHQMMYPSYRKSDWPSWNSLKSYPQHFIDLPFFFFELSEQPNNQDYIEAEYQRYDRLYSIGKYGKQLPICFVASGRNDVKIIERMYDSVRRQNYTNYRMIHIDDSSDDGTAEIAETYLQKHPKFKEKVTLIQMRHKRNALFNRDWANRRYCQEGDIIIDMDADDWIIGNQVFQLVNTVYQTGKTVDGKQEEVWSAFFTNIMSPD